MQPSGAYLRPVLQASHFKNKSQVGIRGVLLSTSETEPIVSKIFDVFSMTGIATVMMGGRGLAKLN